MRISLALLALALPALSGGCVAALVPLAAGGVIAKDQIGGRKSAAAKLPEARPVDIPLPPVTQVDDRPATEDRVVLLQGVTELPAPLMAPPVPQTGPASGTFGPPAGSFESLYRHALAMAQRDPVDAPRKSALLAAPGSFDPQTRECGILPPAVLIDLDPGQGVFDPQAAASPASEAGPMLQNLRLQGVDILWISAQSAGEAGAVRRRLVSSGLDPQGRDSLVLMRRNDDRKQTRRAELAQTHCLVAIAGDTRADFDELFLYLKNPATAAPLDVLLGAGWFLTPLPLDPSKG